MSWPVAPAVGRPVPPRPLQDGGPYRAEQYRPLSDAERARCRVALAHYGYSREHLAECYQVPLRDIHEALGEACLACEAHEQARERHGRLARALLHVLAVILLSAGLTAALRGCDSGTSGVELGVLRAVRGVA